MPQLDTSTWLTMILSMFLTLFIIFQLKISKHNFYYNPELTSTKMLKQNTPWETKWTKIYLPLLLPL
ncbi:ATP synthase F0 subunit 8 (mitochondrion) [Bos mutus]|uniref:ATP synthase F(0) complex subunit 8 n=5 Tax=Bovinae TaxID=27592 RepID=ATP8_BOSMU|nr:ATP synthase F0 subunit 8 [Bos grunniens]YP_009107151.1 ATP synthase F0 subunit 8 [Bos mutus]Q5Y4Q6.1 RecName: Full=ATP synthase protein 8; AltName: Full=A6L; AltName: Full=F-ATPase subunit 8 [Bos grunniens]ALG65265.1 ATP synthase F0 subunit 8 [Bison priscus]QOH99524.1 ATP synthase F0 subunit 8 [Bos grunniens x Bos taurus]AAU89110.1 ATP synthase F0 subunit 8 [Bos grunniens]ABP38003.1 ATP synthase F0 subunit 8 [Bos grunniens]ABP38016.1 ATP synthase F0 subunit 8 [Bos grunniens]